MADEDDPPIPDDDPEIAAERAVLREKRKKTLSQDEEAAIFWRAVFTDPIGRREMWGILQSLHTFEERFACGPNGFPQPEATWFEAGVQATGQRLWRSWLRMCPDGVVVMTQENDPAFQQALKPKRLRRVRTADQ